MGRWGFVARRSFLPRHGPWGAVGVRSRPVLCAPIWSAAGGLPGEPARVDWVGMRGRILSYPWVHHHPLDQIVVPATLIFERPAMSPGGPFVFVKLTLLSLRCQAGSGKICGRSLGEWTSHSASGKIATRKPAILGERLYQKCRA